MKEGGRGGGDWSSGPGDVVQIKSLLIYHTLRSRHRTASLQPVEPDDGENQRRSQPLFALRRCDWASSSSPRLRGRRGKKNSRESWHSRPRRPRGFLLCQASKSRRCNWRPGGVGAPCHRFISKRIWGNALARTEDVPISGLTDVERGNNMEQPCKRNPPPGACYLILLGG